VLSSWPVSSSAFNNRPTLRQRGDELIVADHNSGNGRFPRPVVRPSACSIASRSACARACQDAAETRRRGWARRRSRIAPCARMDGVGPVGRVVAKPEHHDGRASRGCNPQRSAYKHPWNNPARWSWRAINAEGLIVYTNRLDSGLVPDDRVIPIGPCPRRAGDAICRPSRFRSRPSAIQRARSGRRSDPPRLQNGGNLHARMRAATAVSTHARLRRAPEALALVKRTPSSASRSIFGVRAHGHAPWSR